MLIYIFMKLSDENNNDLNNDLDKGVLLEAKPKVKKPSMYNVLLLNPLDPGWDSTNELQKEYIKIAQENNWKCIELGNGLKFCEK